MLHLIVDALHGDDSVQATHFFAQQLWQMNLMNALNQSRGVAKLLAEQHGLASGNWHIASPIHWEATHNDAMIVIDGLSSVEAAELKHFFQVFQGFLERDDLSARELSSGVWLFDAKNLLDCQLPSLDAVMHRSLQTFLLEMPKEWRTWFTEIQMLFHSASPSGSALINGVWPWGGGDYQLNVPMFSIGEFPGLDTKLWTLTMDLPSQGVLLVPERQAQDFQSVFNKKYSGRVAATWWWRNKSYQTRPVSFWDKVKSWFSDAN